MELDVVIRNKERQKLVGTLSYPEGKDPCPGVVLCHGFTANKDLHFFPELAAALTRSGIAVLRFDCHACGRSEGDIHPTYKTMIEDLRAAISYLKDQERITKIGVAGHSMGGTSAIMAAAEDPEILATVTYAAVANTAQSAETKREKFTLRDEGTYSLRVEKLGRDFTFTEDWFSDAKALKPLEAVTKSPAPLLIIHGTEDKKIPMEEAKQLFLAAKLPKSIKMIEGADHVFSDHHDPLIASTARFFKEHLLGIEDE